MIKYWGEFRSHSQKYANIARVPITSPTATSKNIDKEIIPTLKTNSM